MKESADFVTHVTTGQQCLPSQVWDKELGVGRHSHKGKSMQQKQKLGSWEIQRRLWKKKNTNLLISQKSIAHTACFLCSLARGGLWWNRTGNCVKSVLHRRVVRAMVKQNLEDKSQEVRLICEDISPISASAAVARDQVILKEKYKCSKRNDAERAGGDRGCASIADTRADTDHCSPGSVPAEFSAPSKTPSS